MVLDLIACIFDIFTILIFYHELLGDHIDSISPKLYYFAVVIAEVILYICYFLFYNDYSITKALVTSGLSLTLLFLLTFLHKCSIKHRIFTTISFQTIAGISETIIVLITELLPSKISQHITNNMYYASLCSRIMTFILICIFFLVFNRKKKDYSMTYSILVLFMPFVSFFMVFTMPQPNDMAPVQTTLSICGMNGLLFANIVNYYLLTNLIRVKELERETSEMERQVEYQSNKYQQISTVYRSTRRLIHDTKKHFFYISDCARKNECDSIISYLSHAVKDLENSYAKINTGNLVIDAFVSNAMSLAENEHIKFTTDIQITTDHITMSDYDLCIIIGNLLDNAMEACRKINPPKSRHIFVHLFTTGKEFVVHIYNTISDKQPLAKIDQSTLYHGFGTRNVQIITTKYYGTYTFFVEDGIYHAVVNIPYIDENLRKKLDLKKPY